MSRFQTIPRLGTDRAQTIALLCIATIGLLASAAAWWVDRRFERERLRIEFARISDQQAYLLASRIEEALLRLESIEAFYNGSVRVEREEFRRFTRPLLARDRSVQSLEWIPRVPRAEREEYERRARAEGLSDFQFLESNERGDLVRRAVAEVYFPIYYLEPPEGNLRPTGLDLASKPLELKALWNACHSARPIASPPVSLFQNGKSSDLGVLIFHPIYQLGRPASTPLERADALQGFALGVLQIREVVESARIVGDVELRLSLTDETDPMNPLPLFRDEGIPEDPFSRRHLRQSIPLPVGERTWKLVTAPSESLKAGRLFWYPFLTLLAVLSITSVFTTFVYHNLTSQSRLRRLNLELEERVQNRTRALQRSNVELKQFAYIASHDLQEPLRSIKSFAELLQQKYRKNLDSKGQDWLERVVTGTERMQRPDQRPSPLFQGRH